jgi:hypothetical protein
MTVQVAVGQKLDQYRTTDYTFGDSRECKFLVKLLTVRTTKTILMHNPSVTRTCCVE